MTRCERRTGNTSWSLSSADKDMVDVVVKEKKGVGGNCTALSSVLPVVVETAARVNAYYRALII